MSWWSRLLDRLRGATAPAEHGGPPPAPPGEPAVYECQTCFKVFDADRPGALCPECDSPDVISLTR